MFSLLYGLWEYVFRKEELRALILGLDKAGKTTLLEKLKVLQEFTLMKSTFSSPYRHQASIMERVVSGSLEVAP